MAKKNPIDADLAALAATLKSFVALPPRSERALLERFKPRRLSRGERLLSAGDVCEGIGFVAEGLLVSQASDGRLASCDVFAERDFVTDYVSFLSGAPSSVDILAEEDARVLWLDRTALVALYDSADGVDRLGRLIAERQYVALVQRTGELLTRDPAERYRTLVTTRPEWVQRLPQYLLARWLGITPESLSRIRRRLVRGTASRRGRD